MNNEKGGKNTEHTKKGQKSPESHDMSEIYQ